MQDIFGASFDSDINALNDKAVKEPPSLNECSSSSWVEMESNIIGTMKIYPLTPASKQVLSLRYLTPLGEYQEVYGLNKFFKIMSEILHIRLNLFLIRC